MSVAYWLMKTEPNEFSYDDLVSRGREPWNGVRNFRALKHMRAMHAGELFLFYHTGNQRAIVAVARIASEPYPDPAAADARFVAVDVEPGYPLLRPLPLSEIKADARFSDWELVRQPRLSVMPVSQEHWQLVHRLTATQPLG